MFATFLIAFVASVVLLFVIDLRRAIFLCFISGSGFALTGYLLYPAPVDELRALTPCQVDELRATGTVTFPQGPTVDLERDYRMWQVLSAQLHCGSADRERSEFRKAQDDALNEASPSE
jgi:hypothetical protein